MSFKADKGARAMDSKELAKIRKMLLTERERLLNNASISKRDELTHSLDDLADEADLASAELSHGVAFNIRQKEKQKLTEIDTALAKIEEGEYGACEECGDDIPLKRLELFPMAKLCIVHQEELERKKKRFVA
jgi:DnaK suppressor protein